MILLFSGLSSFPEFGVLFQKFINYIFVVATTVTISAKVNIYFLYFPIPSHVNFDLCPAHAAHVITQAGNEQDELDLTWVGMGKYKKYLILLKHSQMLLQKISITQTTYHVSS